MNDTTTNTEQAHNARYAAEASVEHTLRSLSPRDAARVALAMAAHAASWIPSTHPSEMLAAAARWLDGTSLAVPAFAIDAIVSNRTRRYGAEHLRGRARPLALPNVIDEFGAFSLVSDWTVSSQLGVDGDAELFQRCVDAMASALAAALVALGYRGDDFTDEPAIRVWRELRGVSAMGLSTRAHAEHAEWVARVDAVLSDLGLSRIEAA